LETINLPFGLGSFSICAALGASGSGGAGVSAGGNYLQGGCTINLNAAVGGLYVAGNPGTGGLFGQPGIGPSVNQSFTIPISIFSIATSVSATGGDGGEYGFPGDASFMNISVGFNVTVPFIGNINVYTINANQGSLGLNFPSPGTGGNCIKRNGNPFLPLPDAFYTTQNFKGLVGN
jgi:hypothetical protein